MKLKFYLRGIGIGIIVAVAICICAGNKAATKTMTDAEVISRAKELGMTESTVLADIAAPTVEVTEIVQDTEQIAQADTEEVPEEQTEAAETVEDKEEEAIEEEASDDTKEAEAEPTPEPTAEPTPEPTAEPTPEPAKEPESTESDDGGDFVIITVDRGNGSDTVAKKLAAAGLVANASEYDKWLMQNGYDRSIAAGAHKIPKGASQEEIAKIICNRK